jgi:hypothetical protein
MPAYAGMTGSGLFRLSFKEFIMNKKWIAALSLLSLAGVIGAFSARQSASPKCIDVSIGRYHGSWPSLRASILRLSEEIKKFPHADVYIIRREIFYVGWQAKNPNLMTKYDRCTKTLYDDRYGDGTIYLWRGITDKAIHAVASLPHGTFEDFAKFGCVRVRRQTHQHWHNNLLHPTVYSDDRSQASCASGRG